MLEPTFRRPLLTPLYQVYHLKPQKSISRKFYSPPHFTIVFEIKKPQKSKGRLGSVVFLQEVYSCYESKMILPIIHNRSTAVIINLKSQSSIFSLRSILRPIRANFSSAPFGMIKNQNKVVLSYGKFSQFFIHCPIVVSFIHTNFT